MASATSQDMTLGDGQTKQLQQIGMLQQTCKNHLVHPLQRWGPIEEKVDCAHGSFIGGTLH